ncbi:MULTISPECIES: NAD(P)H-hydrate dehydratase [unclassified Massilia]|uniref:NAD(P)H-hydrate dehydratase n=1 Tax=unclassified Massilia TaxID=2609279 RepID=UPI001B822420|nr:MULTISPECIES: NAD(P)H-hydrate dehydratase [unclassified Massilia]MBQ5942310.1 NAD(P)H-hydrate dehydratase [Massilia sp. AB1]MBQ5965780.1 NAD(P)H-hydrate dehydratase [Massilia sp. ZL223]
MESSIRAIAVHDIDAALLAGWPLPWPESDGDKELRGHVLIVGGSSEMPGAIILAATAALRAGAGKLTVATGASVAQLVALAMPEARVIGLREHASDGFSLEALDSLDPLADRVDAVLIGPGMRDEAATAALVHALLPRLDATRTAVVLDACAMGVLRHPPRGWPEGMPFRFERPVVLTPHAGEMAHLTGAAKADIVAEPDALALVCARQWNAVLALKGARTVIAAPDGVLWQHEGAGNIGLAISGSGDVLAGIVAGLAARGAPLAQATCWGVALHARAGDRLAQRLGTLGYLAREISHEIPALLEQLGARDGAGSDTNRPGR